MTVAPLPKVSLDALASARPRALGLLQDVAGIRPGAPLPPRLPQRLDDLLGHELALLHEHDGPSGARASAERAALELRSARRTLRSFADQAGTSANDAVVHRAAFAVLPLRRAVGALDEAIDRGQAPWADERWEVGEGQVRLLTAERRAGGGRAARAVVATLGDELATAAGAPLAHDDAVGTRTRFQEVGRLLAELELRLPPGIDPGLRVPGAALGDSWGELTAWRGRVGRIVAATLADGRPFTTGSRLKPLWPADLQRELGSRDYTGQQVLNLVRGLAATTARALRGHEGDEPT